jgi:heat shock protein HslJ
MGGLLDIEREESTVADCLRRVQPEGNRSSAVLPPATLAGAIGGYQVYCSIVMMHFRSFCTLIAIISLSTACGDGSAAPTSPTAASPSNGTGSSTSSGPAATGDRLTGTWNLSSIQLAGQAVQTTPADAIYTLTFGNGRLSTRTDCNTCSGSFTYSGQTLVAGPGLACTRAACPTLGFENLYTRILSGEHTVRVSADALVLSSSRGALRFAR